MGIVQLLRKFSMSSDKPINESSVRSWVVAYKKELRKKRRIGDVQVLPQCKKGEKLDCKVKQYVHAVCEAGSPVTTNIDFSA